MGMCVTLEKPSRENVDGVQFAKALTSATADFDVGAISAETWRTAVTPNDESASAATRPTTTTPSQIRMRFIDLSSSLVALAPDVRLGEEGDEVVWLAEDVVCVDLVDARPADRRRPVPLERGSYRVAVLEVARQLQHALVRIRPAGGAVDTNAPSASAATPPIRQPFMRIPPTRRIVASGTTS